MRMAWREQQVAHIHHEVDVRHNRHAGGYWEFDQLPARVLMLSNSDWP
jgi:hypothetical protein